MFLIIFLHLPSLSTSDSPPKSGDLYPASSRTSTYNVFLFNFFYFYFYFCWCERPTCRSILFLFDLNKSSFYIIFVQFEDWWFVKSIFILYFINIFLELILHEYVQISTLLMSEFKKM